MTQSSRPLEQTGHEQQARLRPLCRPGARSGHEAAVQTVTASKPRAAGEVEADVHGEDDTVAQTARADRTRAAGEVEAAVHTSPWRVTLSFFAPLRHPKRGAACEWR